MCVKCRVRLAVRLNIATQPIAKKYCEGKMKSITRVKLIELETAVMEAVKSDHVGDSDIVIGRIGCA